MNGFWEFLDTNVNKVQSGPSNGKYREGVSGADFLESVDTSSMDAISRARFLYIKNLCLNDPVEFDVPEALGSSEKGLMLMSFNSIENALACLDTGLECEVVGIDARTRTGAQISVPVLQTRNTRSQDLVRYRAHGYCYGNFRVEPLDTQELIYMYAKMMDIYRNEDNETLKKFRINAYLQRMEMEENMHNDALVRAFAVLDASVNNTTDKLDKIKDSMLVISESLFAMPIVFKFDMMIQLGLSLRSNFLYSEAYQILASYPMYLERIDCLMALRRSQDAVDEISAYISRIGDSEDRNDRMILCNLFIKLGHLYQDPKYYDMAAGAFSSSRPHHIKGLFHFNRKEYDLAVEAFEKALRLAPCNYEIRLSYACTLVELDRISEALEILQVLKDENPMDGQVSKNLSYCYYKKRDIESTLRTLKSVAMSDPSSMNRLFLISIKNKKMDEVRWALPKMNSIDYIRGGVGHLMSNNLIPVEELKQLVGSNHYVDMDVFHSIFST